MTSLTSQQSDAITAGASVALAAGAGCGKTFVLTERFLSCLDPERPGGPLRLDQLTAITFTERAAREMRERIRRACLGRLKAAEERHVDYWLRALRDLDAARISTIHSFCGTLLRAHAVEARLDPHFKTLDATAAQTVLFELVDEELRERLAARDETVIELTVQFGLDKLRDMAGRLLHQRQDIDWSAWHEETPERLVARWETFWRERTRPGILRRVSKSPEAAAVLAILRDEMPSNDTMRERCEVLRDRLPHLEKASDPEAALGEIRAAAMVKGGGNGNAWSSQAVYESFRDAAKALRDRIDGLEPIMNFDAHAARPAAVAALGLLSVAEGLSIAYCKRKKELAALDFDDLLIHARELLVGAARADLRRRLAAQTRLLLVDEFQDTDPLQVQLVRALCDGHVADGRLFFVGDYKQSIYRFRGADPHVFRLLREEIPAAGQLPLTRNFRSQPAVIEFINCLFAAEMGPQYEALEAHRPQLGPAPAVEFLWAEEPEDEHDARSPKSESTAADDASRSEGSLTERTRRREADWIARRLRAMLDGGEKLVWDKDATGAATLRAVRPGDITLLFRALTNVEYYEEALRRYDIEYYLVGGRAFYAQQEIFDIVNLLRAIASPCDEVSLVGILRSPMFGILDETLYRLSRHERGLAGGFWSLLESRSFLPERTVVLGDAERRRLPTRAGHNSPSRQEGPTSRAARQKRLAFDDPPENAAQPEPVGDLDDQELRLRYAAETLAELRAAKDRVPIAQLIHVALERTGYDAMLLAEFLGERKLANLHKLIEKARQFDAAGIFTLSDFIVQLAEFVARQPDEPMAATQPESINAVRLMSIHQSKGLEFPVVVVVDVDRRRNAGGDGVAFTPELGPMVRVPACTSGYELFAQAEAEEDAAETTRLLYVAATRAADHLILASGVEDLDEPRGPWLELLKRRFDLRTGEPISSMTEPGPPLAKVILEEPPLRYKASKTIRPDLGATSDAARKQAAAGRGDVPQHLRPVPVDSGARRQFSVSRLHGTLRPRKVEPAVSDDEEAFSTASALDPLGLGTLVHAVLAELATAKDDSRAAIESLVQRHACIHLPDAEKELEEPIGLIAGLTASPRWASLRAAGRRHAELEFLLAWPLGNAAAEGTYIQGFIDCLYQDVAGEWRLLDYKTNRVSPESLPGVVESYEMQMLVYALAAERVLKRPPAEIVLHFLRGGYEHRFNWTDEARQRAANLVDAAIRSAAKS